MALQIDKTTREGFTVSYWRVSPSVTYDVVAKRLTATVMPYVSAAARTADKPPAHFDSRDFDDARSVTLEGTAAENAIKTGEPRDAVYAHLKTLDFFSGAADV